MKNLCRCRRKAGTLRVPFTLAALMLALSACQMPVKPVKPVKPAIAPVAMVATTPQPLVVAAPEAAPAAGTDTLIDSGAEVFDQLLSRLSQPACRDDARSRHWRSRYAGHPDPFSRQLEAILPLLAYVGEQVEAAGLPGEFALIPLVESGYNPDARGPGGPTGLWQMIASTARANGVRVDARYDGRLSPVESTQAAIRHLSELYTDFGDWRLAAMAYNAGEYRLRRLLRASPGHLATADRPLPGLPRTTIEYIAKLHALACLLTEPDRHGLSLPRATSFVPLPLPIAELPARHAAPAEPAPYRP